DVVDHPAPHLREDPRDVHLRDRRHLGLARRDLLQAARKLHVRAALALDVLPRRDDLRGVRALVELLEHDLALVARRDRAPLDGHRPRVGLVVDLVADGRAGHAPGDALDVDEELPHRRWRGLHDEVLGDLEGHGYTVSSGMMRASVSRSWAGARRST